MIDIEKYQNTEKRWLKENASVSVDLEHGP